MFAKLTFGVSSALNILLLTLSAPLKDAPKSRSLVLFMNDQLTPTSSARVRSTRKITADTLISRLRNDATSRWMSTLCATPAGPLVIWRPSAPVPPVSWM